MMTRFIRLDHSFKDIPCFRRYIPENLLSKFAAFFRADFSAVRVFELKREPLPDVYALTTGIDIYFSPGRFVPGTFEGIELLAHELAHVLQQRGGPIRTVEADSYLMWNPDLESEAKQRSFDAAAFAVSNNPVGSGEVFKETRPGESSEPARRDCVVTDVINLRTAVVFQPYIKMAIDRSLKRDAHFPNPTSWTVIDNHYQLLTDFDFAASQVRRIAQLQGAKPGEIDAAVEVLRRWMGLALNGKVYTRAGEIIRAFGSDAAALARMAIGRHAEFKIFNNYGEMTTALLGEIRSEPGFLYETALAKAVLRTPEIASDLRNLAHGIVRYWDQMQLWLHGPVSTTSRLLGYSTGDSWLFRGSYWQYHRYMTPLTGLKAAPSNKISTNIAVLHDMMEFIKKNATESHLHRTLQWTNQAGGQIDIEKREMRNNLGTVNEDFAVVREGRRLRYRMQAGPSYTVSQMLALADAADASPDERTALAYAIFAFWNQVYQKGCTPIHTYYEVMVAAANYGVQFNANHSFAANAPPAVALVLRDIWERQIDYLEQ
jgi:hypothetical protein